MGEPILMDVTLIFFEIRSWILTLNTLNTTDDISQVNSFPFLDLFFGSGFKSQIESSAAISWSLVGCLGCKSVFLLEMALESSLVGQGISPPLCEASADFPTPTPLPAGSGGNLASTGAAQEAQDLLAIRTPLGLRSAIHSWPGATRSVNSDAQQQWKVDLPVWPN